MLEYQVTRAVENILGLLWQTSCDSFNTQDWYIGDMEYRASFSCIGTFYSVTTPGLADVVQVLPSPAILGRIKVQVPSFADMCLPHLYTLATTILHGNQPMTDRVWYRWHLPWLPNSVHYYCSVRPCWKNWTFVDTHARLAHYLMGCRSFTRPHLMFLRHYLRLTPCTI